MKQYSACPILQKVNMAELYQMTNWNKNCNFTTRLRPFTLEFSSVICCFRILRNAFQIYLKGAQLFEYEQSVRSPLILLS